MQLALDGSGGTYFLKSGGDRRGTNVAVFKPEDEEPFAPENPRGFQGRLGQGGLRAGILSGEAAVREAAAYRLDVRTGGKFRVPVSVMVELVCQPQASRAHSAKQYVRKQGSLQRFVKHDDTASDVSHSLFSVRDVQTRAHAHACGRAHARARTRARTHAHACAQVHDVHRIVILDLHVVNTDRNVENILCHYPNGRRDSGVASLTPIDHGCSAAPASHDRGVARDVQRDARH